MWDTPGWLRVGLFVAAAAACANIPFFLHRWVWRHRRLEQLARLLARKHPRVGDQLLGIIELVHNEFEQARSPALCEAAIREVAQDAERRRFSRCGSHPRHRLWLLAGGRAAGRRRSACSPSSRPRPSMPGSGSWLPWGSTPRYTFTVLEKLPDRPGRRPRRAVFARPAAHEQDGVAAQAGGRPARRPAPGDGPAGRRAATTSSCRPQIDPGQLHVKIGDASQDVRIEPTLRPELTSIVASVALPAYLGHRRAAVEGRARRGGLAGAGKPGDVHRHGQPRAQQRRRSTASRSTPAGAAVSSPPAMIEGSRKIEFRWQDKLGLAGKEPFSLAITGREDEAPSLSCEDLPRQKVVLDTEQLELQGPGPG